MTRATNWRYDDPSPPSATKPEVDLEPVRRRVEDAWHLADDLAAEGRTQEARVLLERAHRRARSDQNLVLALALIRFRDGDAAGSAALFDAVVREHDVREAWNGLALARLILGDVEGAFAACASCLRTHVADASSASIARAVLAARPDLAPGWCTLTETGEVRTSLEPGVLTVCLDGERVEAGVPLPTGWTAADLLTVEAGGRPLLGSSVSVQSIWRVEGFAERTARGVAGWVWHPGAPETDPPLRILDGAGVERISVVATDLGAAVGGDAPGARPRRFDLDVPWRGPVRVVGRDGHDLAGSPVAPWPRRHRVRRIGPVPLSEEPGPVDVVIPVYRGREVTLACINAVSETVPATTRVWVVVDGSPDAGLVAALQALAGAGTIRMIGSGESGGVDVNRGFPAAANAGLRAAAGRDAVLLNSDTLVAGQWLQTLQSAAYSEPDIGTATAVSNEASILSVPDPDGGNPRRRFRGNAAAGFPGYAGERRPSR